MIIPSVHLILKQCRSSLFRPIIVIKPRRLSTRKQQQDNHQTLVQPQHVEITKLSQKAQQAAKDTVYSLVVVAGVVTLGGLCYLILHEIYSRETPNGIYKEASRMCLANSHVQEALGTPIFVHTTPQMGLMRINNVRAQMFDEKGHQSMTVSFYLTGKERSGVVAVKVQKNISNKFVYDYILVQLDRPWEGRNIIQVHHNLTSSSLQTLDL